MVIFPGCLGGEVAALSARLVIQVCLMREPDMQVERGLGGGRSIVVESQCSLVNVARMLPNILCNQ